MPGVTIKGLTKRYGDVAALEGLDLRVEPGELVSLLGPSGCGKTTTLRLLAGFLQPEAGEIWVGDRCLSSPTRVIPPERRRMAMIFQSYALWPHMTVAQNIAYGLRLKPGVPKAAREARVKEMLKVVQLDGYGSRYPGELSGGQQQRAAAEPGVVPPGALRLRVAVTGLKPGAPVVVSIRPHEIRLVARGQPPSPDPNVLAGVVQRASYLGDAVDYQVRVNGSDVALRVTAPPPAVFRSGATVTLALAPEACVPLTEAETP